MRIPKKTREKLTREKLTREKVKRGALLRTDSIEFPAELPITPRIGEIVELLKRHQVVIVAGETGSGKTTQLPKACLLAGLGARGGIVHTQPRRLAARTVASRIASELGVDSRRGGGLRGALSPTKRPRRLWSRW